MVNYVGFKKYIFAFAVAILILICLCCAVLLKSGEDYTKKILALASDEAVEIKEIFDFEFDRAYVFDEPYLSGEGLAEYYDLDISIDEVESVPNFFGRLVFVDIDGNLVYTYEYSKEEITFVERLVIFPSTLIQKNPAYQGEIPSFYFVGVERLYSPNTDDEMLEYPQLIIDKPYYKLNLIKSFFYTYELLDFDGNILDNQCTYYCEPKFTELTGDIVKIYVQTGTGRISSQTQYYDTRQALISPIYDYVLCEHGNYVAVGDLERNAVVIYDMFDNDNIISIIPLENLLITTDDPIEWASFANNMGDIDISYRTPDGTKNIRSAILN